MNSYNKLLKAVLDADFNGRDSVKSHLKLETTRTYACRIAKAQGLKLKVRQFDDNVYIIMPYATQGIKDRFDAGNMSADELAGIRGLKKIIKRYRYAWVNSAVKYIDSTQRNTEAASGNEVQNVSVDDENSLSENTPAERQPYPFYNLGMDESDSETDEFNSETDEDF